MTSAPSLRSLHPSHPLRFPLFFFFTNTLTHLTLSTNSLFRRSEAVSCPFPIAVSSFSCTLSQNCGCGIVEVDFVKELRFPLLSYSFLPFIIFLFYLLFVFDRVDTPFSRSLSLFFSLFLSFSALASERAATATVCIVQFSSLLCCSPEYILEKSFNNNCGIRSSLLQLFFLLVKDESQQPQ